MSDKKKVEALLFSSGKKMSVEGLMKLCRMKEEDVVSALKELKSDYDERGGSFKLMEEGRDWKFVVKEEFLPLVKKIVTETELPKSVLETLAVIAFRYPIKQSDLINIRTNKAYDHLALLEESGYITRVKYGRTKLIKLTDRFFQYFDLPPEKLKETFNSFQDIAKAIEAKEQEIKRIKEEQKKKAENAGKKEVDLVDEEGKKVKLDTYDSTPIEVEKEGEKSDIEIVSEEPEEESTEKELEVYDVQEQAAKVEEEVGEESAEEEQQEETEEASEEEKQGEAEDSSKEEKTEEPVTEKTEEKKEKSIDDEVDKRVEEILHPKKADEEKE